MRRSATFLTLLCSSVLAFTFPSCALTARESQDIIVLPDTSADNTNSKDSLDDHESNKVLVISDSQYAENFISQDSDVTFEESEASSFAGYDTTYDSPDPEPDTETSLIPETGPVPETDPVPDTESEYTLSSASDLDIGQTGTDAVLVMDVSGSMVNSDPDYLCKKAALDFITDLSKEENSRIGLVTFSDKVIDDIPLTAIVKDDRDNEVLTRLNGLTYTKEDTDIGTAMQEASRILMKTSTDSRARTIFLLTDGEIDLPREENEEEAEKASLTRALVAVEDAKNQGIVIHTISLDLSGSMNTNLMNYMADSTGGTASHVRSPIELEDVFSKLSEYAKKQALELAKAAETARAETETETETQTETETETETESEPILAVQTSGTITGPVHLKGLLPHMCEAQLNLGNLFYLDNASKTDLSPVNNGIRYTAYADDNSILSCKVEGEVLSLTGLKNGTTHVNVYAEPDLPLSGESRQASLRFAVSTEAMIPSPLYLLAIPALILSAAILILLIRKRSAGDYPLLGTLQWYVRGENEKIFGIPGQLYADLEDYGNRLILSELIQDEMVLDADLHKVTITAAENGIRITSKSSACLIQASGSKPEKSVEITDSGRFKIYCETGRGQAAIIAFYSLNSAKKSESSFEDDSDERTRMLI